MGHGTRTSMRRCADEASHHLPRHPPPLSARLPRASSRWYRRESGPVLVEAHAHLVSCSHRLSLSPSLSPDLAVIVDHNPNTLAWANLERCRNGQKTIHCHLISRSTQSTGWQSARIALARLRPSKRSCSECSHHRLGVTPTNLLQQCWHLSVSSGSSHCLSCFFSRTKR